MGDGFSVECAECGASEIFLLGIGMMYSGLANVIEDVPPRARARIEAILSEGTTRDPEFEQRLYACPKCDTLRQRLYVRIEYGEGQVYETRFRCGRCRSLLVAADRDVETYCCKRCGKRSLHAVGGINWD